MGNRELSGQCMKEGSEKRDKCKEVGDPYEEEEERLKLSILR